VQIEICTPVIHHRGQTPANSNGNEVEVIGEAQLIPKNQNLPSEMPNHPEPAGLS
jgi:hypothetical protein